MNMNLFNSSGAFFSDCRKYRYALWRIWDDSKPLVMFIGLNPSTADETEPDPTIKRVCAIANYNGYGGIYMMNCFPFVSTKPEEMLLCKRNSVEWNINESWLYQISKTCKEVVFAWGNFDVIKQINRDKDLSNLFPQAKALVINTNGSPKHPLYCKKETILINYHK